MPLLIAEAAGRDDILFRIAATIAARDEVLSRAFEMASLSDRYSICRREPARVVDTHRDAAIVASTILVRRRGAAQTLKSGRHNVVP